MSKRRRKRRKRQQAAARGKTTAASTATAPETTEAGPPARKEPIVAWRTAVRRLLDEVRAFAQNRHGEAVDQVLRAHFGDPPEPEHPADLERALDDLIATPGTAGDGRSIAAAYAEAAEDLADLDREQLRRWERERRRGVFLTQNCFADRIEAWDPLEGAGLTLSLLDRLPPARAAEIRPGTVITAVYVPYVARLVAIGLVEMFGDPQAMAMFREQVEASGSTWHDAPPTAPRADAT
ncbi:MAG: hypothetical protein QNJ98_13220 [Planctomycetota bacterium]|nr:hypothetical protein [Planctomycetota bacterium]